MKAPPIWPAGQLYHLKGDTVCSSNEWQPSHTSQTGRQVIFLVKEPIFSSCWPCRAQKLACPPSNWHTPTPICGPADIGIPKYKYIYSYTNTNTQMKMSYFKVAVSWDHSLPGGRAKCRISPYISFLHHSLLQIFVCKIYLSNIFCDKYLLFWLRAMPATGGRLKSAW